ncbi:TetR/AcrR family transcriptional regulator [Nocardia sp. NPDC058518]|uniref:TetR/AcrR family transcriptional regulator n=1 Tax=Nocardia sp. NPDC058518 TaxID=3346534 RepID=UPI003654872F
MSVVAPASSEPLPPGPSAMSRDEVLASQRGRVAWAALQAVSELGYGPTTVSEIVKRAKVSRRTFYVLHRDKEDCYVAAFEMIVEVVDNALNAKLETFRDADWKVLLRKSLEEYLALLSAEPDIARALHVEALSVGPALARHRVEMKKVFANRMLGAHRRGVAQGELHTTPPEGIMLLLIGGIDDRIRDCLNEDGPEGLPELIPDLYAASIALIQNSPSS